MTHRLEEMKVTALERSASMRSGFDKLRKAFEKSGHDSPVYRKAQQALSGEFMPVRFTPVLRATSAGC